MQKWKQKRQNKKQGWKLIGLYYTPQNDKYIYQIGWVNLSFNEIQEILSEGIERNLVRWPTIEEIFGDDVVKDCTDPNLGEEYEEEENMYLI